MTDAEQVGRLGDAIAYAARAHRGQVYRGYDGRPDEPYILHPLRVMAAVSDGAKLVAVLHDCLEDAGSLPESLRGGERQALLLLSRDKAREPYEEYIGYIASARGWWADVAREVKVADLRENLSRNPPTRLRDRYEAALAALGAPDANATPNSIRSEDR